MPTPPPPPTGKKQTANLSALSDAPQLTMRKPKALPPRIVLIGQEGWGKTSALAFADGSAMVMAKGETGYDTLLNAGLVPERPSVVLDKWWDVQSFLDQQQSPDYRILALDALESFEALAAEDVCLQEYSGDWVSFGSYGAGWKVVFREWKKFLDKLDAINQQGVWIVLLCHARIKTFQNPTGDNYDRIIPPLKDTIWETTSHWADCILNGQFITVVEKESKMAVKGKGTGGTERIVYTERRDAWDAKNRYGMPEAIQIPSEPSEVWRTITSQMKGVS